MRSRNPEDHLTPEGVPGDNSGYGEKSAVIFSTIDDDTRVIPAVEFRNVNFAYHHQIVLNDISFRVMRGELVIVLSPSGGGKSTILKLALGLMKPDEGRILIDGEDITDYDEEAIAYDSESEWDFRREHSLILSPFTTTWLSDAMNAVFLKRSLSRKYVVCCGSLTSRMRSI